MDILAVAALLFGIVIGLLPSATFLFLLRELRTRGWTAAAVSALATTAALLAGESWAAGRTAAFLFEQEKGVWVIMGLSGISSVSGIAGFLRYFIFSLRG
jgi:hypothetical protein